MATLDSLAGDSHGRRDNGSYRVRRDDGFSELFQGSERPSPAGQSHPTCSTRFLLLCLLAVTIKHMAHNLIRNAPGKNSLRLKRKAAGWDDDFLADLIAR